MYSNDILLESGLHEVLHYRMGILHSVALASANVVKLEGEERVMLIPMLPFFEIRIPSKYLYPIILLYIIIRNKHRCQFKTNVFYPSS